MQKRKRILVAPLDWGLGHASRCIPIIKELNKQDADVVIAADNLPLKLLRKEFPDMEYVQFPGATIQYTSKNNMLLNIAFQATRFLESIAEEHEFLQKIIKNYAIDAVISDNRYGVYSPSVPSIFITHQLFIKVPFGKKLLRKMIAKYISNFNECWIPDAKSKPNLSGSLSHTSKLPKNHFYIQPLSRFQSNGIETHSFKRMLMIILSGPEPNRTNFENLLLKQLQNCEFKVLMVRGVSQDINTHRVSENVIIKPLLASHELKEEIVKSEIILCRSGYSSIMDLAALNKKAILVPTQGQTEQEYLATKLKDENKCYTVAENELQIKHALEECKKCEALNMETTREPLRKRIEALLNHS